MIQFKNIFNYINYNTKIDFKNLVNYRKTILINQGVNIDFLNWELYLKVLEAKHKQQLD